MNPSIRAVAVTLLGWAGCLALLSDTALGAPEGAIVIGNRANLRAAPSINADVVGSLSKGEFVTVLEKIPVVNPQPDEPTAWARVRLPASVKVWVFAAFVDEKSGAVTAQDVKVRTGAGKNYPAVGELSQGALVAPVRTVDGWTQIQPPPSAIAFVAADLLMTGVAVPDVDASRPKGVTPPAPAPAPAPTVAKEAPAPTVAASGSAGDAGRPPAERPVERPIAPGKAAPSKEAPKSESLTPMTALAPAKPVPANPPTQIPHKIDVVTKSAPAPAAPAAPEVSKVPAPAKPVPGSAKAEVAVASTNLPPLEAGASVQYRQPELVYDEKRPRRVMREGIVGLTISPDGPGWYQLNSIRRGESVHDYLIVEDAKKSDLSKWMGKRVFVEGEEYRDRRWRTPVLKVTSIRPAF